MGIVFTLFFEKRKEKLLTESLFSDILPLWLEKTNRKLLSKRPNGFTLDAYHDDGNGDFLTAIGGGWNQ